MKDKVKVYFAAELPASLLGTFVQHIRDFDATHTECHFEILANTEETEQEVSAWIEHIDPPFPFRRMFHK